ncbi:MAG: hypothetical protein FJ280_21390, partial [Planctomycetes bacterium]|nr:hypothetical protein [Planctomycetota bacterium]
MKAILFFKGTPFDTIGLAQKGASLPLVAAYQKTIYADTTGRGYGPYWAVLWAVDVGAGTRDPVGVVSWTLFPRIASASGVVPRVTVTDSLTKGGFVDSVGHVAVTAHAESISGVDSAIVATLAGVTAESVWVEPIANISWQTGLAADLLRGAQRIATPARSLGEYHVGDSVTVGTKFHEVGLDSVYAYIYSGTTAMDTIKLASTAQGYYSKILVDTAGGGTEGTWQAHLLAFYSTGGNHRATSSNTWRVFNRRLYAQEVAESADVYIHDPS